VVGTFSGHYTIPNGAAKTGTAFDPRQFPRPFGRIMLSACKWRMPAKTMLPEAAKRAPRLLMASS
jgi:hypothetical protein